VTNIPDHRNTGDASFGLQAFATGFKIPNSVRELCTMECTH